MNPHGRPWSSDEALRAASKRWATPGAREAQAARMRVIRHRQTRAEAQRNGRTGGLRSGQKRQAHARQRAVAAALAILRTQGAHGLVEALHVVYARAYRTGQNAVWQRQRRAKAAA